MSRKILVVDDHVSFCNHIQALLENDGYSAAAAYGAEQALDRLSAEPFDILLADMKMPRVGGLELFNMARKIDPDITCIIMTAYGSVSSAVRAMKKGVMDYLEKPFEPEVMLVAIEKVLKHRQMLLEIRNLRKEVSQKYSFGNIIGKNYKMQHIYSLIQRVSPTDARVFITGETGVGKELVAKAIHFNSPRKNKPFVGINCGALSETLLESELFGHEKGAFTGAMQTRLGKFEYAQGGTIFLDEVGDISPSLQVKLLRVLQEQTIERVGGNVPRKVDVRVISATNQDVKDKIGQGEFRVELFYRLNVVPVHIPPLRERIEDVPLLVKHFMCRLNKRFNKDIRHISEKAMVGLMQYDWPGNVRELENVLERAFITAEGDTIDRIIFSPGMQVVGSGESFSSVDVEVPFKVARSVVVRQFEKAYLYEALKRYDGNVSKTAKKCGINPRTLWRKINLYELNNGMLKPEKGSGAGCQYATSVSHA